LYFVTCSPGLEWLFHRFILAAMSNVDNSLPASVI
jgi:hypothetical protein